MPAISLNHDFMQTYVTLVCRFVRLTCSFVEQRLKHRNSDTRKTPRLSQLRGGGTKDGHAGSDSDSGVDVVCIHVSASRVESAKRERERKKNTETRQNEKRKEKRRELRRKHGLTVGLCCFGAGSSVERLPVPLRRTLRSPLGWWRP